MKAKILVVDDDADIGGLIKDFLGSFGHEVFFFENAREALSKIETETFDVVITDRSMPGMDGIEFARSVRKVRPSLPIVGMSGDDNEGTFMHAGADSFVPKPLDLRLLQITIERHFRSSYRDSLNFTAEDAKDAE